MHLIILLVTLRKRANAPMPATPLSARVHTSIDRFAVIHGKNPCLGLNPFENDPVVIALNVGTGSRQGLCRYVSPASKRIRRLMSAETHMPLFSRR